MKNDNNVIKRFKWSLVEKNWSFWQCGYVCIMALAIEMESRGCIV